MINQNVSWFFLPKFHKTSNCPFYRPSGVFSRNWFVNIMHIHVGNMQFYALASSGFFLLFILWAPEMGWNCPTTPQRGKNDSLYENRNLTNENKYILLPKVKKKSIMPEGSGAACGACWLLSVDESLYWMRNKKWEMRNGGAAQKTEAPRRFKICDFLVSLT